MNVIESVGVQKLISSIRISSGTLKAPYKHLVLYHAGCNDGLVSAAIVHKFLKEEVGVDNDLVEYKPVQYGKPFPQLEKDQYTYVYIVDFAYDPEVMEDICSCFPNTYFFTMDHHATAIEKWSNHHFEQTNNFYCIDNQGDLSGVSLVWTKLFPDLDMPDLVKDVADRDLWKFDRENSKEIHLYLLSLHQENNYTPQKVYEYFLSDMPIIPYSIPVRRGKSMKLMFDILVKQQAQEAFEGYIDSYPVIFCNSSSYMITSDTGDYILENIDNKEKYVVALFQFLKTGKVKISFRSKNKKSKAIAESLGGGGQANAAGAEIEKQVWELLLNKSEERVLNEKTNKGINTP